MHIKKSILLQYSNVSILTDSSRITCEGKIKISRENATNSRRTKRKNTKLMDGINSNRIHPSYYLRAHICL